MSRGPIALSLAIAALLAAPAQSQVRGSMTPPRAITLCQPKAPGTGEPNASARRILAAAERHLDDKPHALAHVHTEGTLPHQGIRDESIEAERDWPLARQAALAWRLSADARYLRQVDSYLAAWSATYQPDFNPIDETNLDGLIDAYVLASAALPASTRDATRALLRKLGDGYIARIRAFPGKNKAGSQTNNWQSHRVKLVTLAAAALAAKPFGGDWLHEASPRGASLAKALDWLRPYAEGGRTHEEFVHTHVKFDRDREQAGEKGYSGPWDRKSATALYWLAAQLDDSYLPLARQLSPEPPDWIGACSFGQ